MRDSVECTQTDHTPPSERCLDKSERRKVCEDMPEQRPTYHHGDLRAALIRAADEIISEGGIEVFSLRAAAKRAGVSPAAPAHHFGSARGLLTEVAILAFERLNQYLEQAGHSADAAVDIRGLALAYVRFALDYPGHYRLMLRKDLVDRTGPRYGEAADEQATRLKEAFAAYRGREFPARHHGAEPMDQQHFQNAADLLASLAMVHGLVYLVLDEKAPHLFGDANARAFVEQTLPRVLESVYPTVQAS